MWISIWVLLKNKWTVALPPFRGLADKTPPPAWMERFAVCCECCGCEHSNLHASGSMRTGNEPQAAPRIMTVNDMTRAVVPVQRLFVPAW